MFDYIEPFYHAAEKAIEPGQIWSDQPIYLPPRKGMKVTRVNPKDDRDLDFKLCGRTAETFSHPPIHSVPLAASEAAVFAVAKKDRPVIVLGGLRGVEVSPGRDTSGHNETAWIVPVYGADQYTEHMRRRMAYYEFTNLFYLPASRDPAFDEGFARLDHAQPVHLRHLSKHRGLRLAPEALDALLEWFVSYSTQYLPRDSLILEYRKERLRELAGD